MGFEEYLKRCTEQLRCKAMRPVVEKELRNHLEEQKEAYLAEGMEEKEAEAMAVRDMGDPVETGTGLDRVHRPRMDWKTVGLIFVQAVTGILVQFLMAKDGLTADGFQRFLQNTVLGIGVMFLVCFVDYTFIGKHPRLLWVLSLYLAVLSRMMTPTINGMENIIWFIMLMVPMFAGIVFYYRSQKVLGILKVFAWLGFSFVVLSVLTTFTLMEQLLLIAGGIVMLGYAVGKGWYGVKRRWAAAVCGLPVLGLIPLVLLTLSADGFRAIRLRAWVNPAAYANGAGYLPTQILKALDHIQFLAASRQGAPAFDLWKSRSEDYFLLLLAQWHGLVFVLVLLLLFTGLLTALLYRLRRQKNRLGMLVGAGCLWVFLVMGLVHTLMNFGLMPTTNCSMPFFSMNGKQVLSLYCLMGMLLSVFRTTATLPEPETKKGDLGQKIFGEGLKSGGL